MAKKTLRQLEKEYAQYIAGTKEKAKATREALKKAPTIPVRSRHVTIFSPSGKRMREAKWGRWQLWHRFPDTTNNLKDALRYTLSTLKKKGLGSVIYVGNVPVFDAKMGADRVPYVSWKDNPTAYNWKVRTRL